MQYCNVSTIVFRSSIFAMIDSPGFEHQLNSSLIFPRQLRWIICDVSEEERAIQSYWSNQLPFSLITGLITVSNKAYLRVCSLFHYINTAFPFNIDRTWSNSLLHWNNRYFRAISVKVSGLDSPDFSIGYVSE